MNFYEYKVVLLYDMIKSEVRNNECNSEFF